MAVALVASSVGETGEFPRTSTSRTVKALERVRHASGTDRSMVVDFEQHADQANAKRLANVRYGSLGWPMLPTRRAAAPSAPRCSCSAWKAGGERRARSVICRGEHGATLTLSG